MASARMEVAQELYEARIRMTEIKDYGLKLEDLLSAKAAPPPQGARLEGYFQGEITGARLRGTIVGVDYALVRADGDSRLHVHARITTTDNHSISFFADGVFFPEPGTGRLQLRENVTLHSTSAAYAWVNKLQIWATGWLDLAAGTIILKGYEA
jgi:hypothetical protein